MIPISLIVISGNGSSSGPSDDQVVYTDGDGVFYNDAEEVIYIDV